MTIKSLVKAGLAVSLCFSSQVFAGDPFLGAKVYNEHCANCHGANGKGQIAGTPDFLQTNILSRSDFELQAFIQAGRGIMPSFQGILKDRQIMDVIAYIRTFN